jgi:hypothetical protein
MGSLGLVAVGALLQLRELEREMGAPISLAGVGDLSLGHTHETCCSFRAGSDGQGRMPGRARSLPALVVGVDPEGPQRLEARVDLFIGMWLVIGSEPQAAFGAEARAGRLA